MSTRILKDESCADQLIASTTYIHVYLAVTQLAACDFKSTARQNLSKASTKTNTKQQ